MCFCFLKFVYVLLEERVGEKAREREGERDLIMS